MPRAEPCRQVCSMKQRYRSGCRPARCGYCGGEPTNAAMHDDVGGAVDDQVGHARAARGSPSASARSASGSASPRAATTGRPRRAARRRRIRPHPRRVTDLQVEAAAGEDRGEVEVPVEEALLLGDPLAHHQPRMLARAPRRSPRRRRSRAPAPRRVPSSSQLVAAPSVTGLARRRVASRAPSGLRPSSACRPAIHWSRVGGSTTAPVDGGRGRR